MRVSQISVYHQPNINHLKKRSNNYQLKCKPEEPACAINFKGKFGAIVGGTFGAIAVVATALIAAPAAICLTGGGAILGAISGDTVEDAINDDDNN